MNDFYTELRKLMPLKYKKEDGDFKCVLSKALSEYHSLLEEYKTELISNMDDVIPFVDKSIAIINQCAKSYYEGMYSHAYNLLEQILSDPIYEVGIRTINEGETFYRARIFDTTGRKTREEMFHISLDKRGIVKTQRYSAPGYPCLYLGAHINACWVELREPRFDDMMVSRFSVKNRFPVLDLRMPTEKDFEKGCSECILKKLPLIISTSVCVLNPDDPFKPEYIIPQLITEYIITQNRVKYDRNERTKFEYNLGVYYTSTHINNDLEFPEYTFNNLALPVVDFDMGQKYCQLLASCFEWTDPTSYAYEDIRNSFNITGSTLDLQEESKYTKPELNYKCSKMGKLEELISHYDAKTFPNILEVNTDKINLLADGQQLDSLEIRANCNWSITAK